MRKRGAQLALKFPLSSRATFDTFEVGGNGELVERLERLPATDGFTGALLWGAGGSGRSHLLQAACHRFGAGGASAGGAIYLPLADSAVAPDSLEGLEAVALVALDDVDAWVGNADAELAVLALYQGLHVAGGRLLVSASGPPAAMAFHYRDLASRLRGLPTYQVRGLDDEQKVDVLRRLAAQRGLELRRPVLDFWLTRRSRDLSRLQQDLDRLDDAAMAAQRRLTVPLLKEVLGL